MYPHMYPRMGFVTLLYDWRCKPQIARLEAEQRQFEAVFIRELLQQHHARQQDAI